MFKIHLISYTFLLSRFLSSNMCHLLTLCFMCSCPLASSGLISYHTYYTSHWDRQEDQYTVTAPTIDSNSIQDVFIYICIICLYIYIYRSGVHYTTLTYCSGTLYFAVEGLFSGQESLSRFACPCEKARTIVDFWKHMLADGGKAIMPKNESGLFDAFTALLGS